MTPQQRLIAQARDARSRREGSVLERNRAAQDRLNRIDARGQEIMRAGFLGAWTDASGPEITIGTRAPCGESLRIPLDGPLPVCGATCECSADARRRAKERAR